MKYVPDMKEDDPRALLNQQIPSSFVCLHDEIRKELVTFRVNDKPPIMMEKDFCAAFSKLFDSIAEMKEAVRFLSLQGKVMSCQ